MSHQVFICAAPHDKVAASAICAVLEAEGMACWLAARDLASGADPVKTAGAAIAAAQVLVLVFSSQANEAEQQISRELHFAAESRTPVLPFRIENVKPVRGLEYFLPASQFVDAYAPPLDAQLRRLAAMLGPALEEAAPRPPMPEMAPFAGVGVPSQVLLEAEPVEVPPQAKALSQTPAEPVSIPQAEAPSAPVPMMQADRVEPPLVEAAWPAPESPSRTAAPAQDEDAEPRFRRPLLLAAALVAIVVGAGLWWVIKPGPGAAELQAWASASRVDAIPAYQSYLGAWPKGFYRDQASARAIALKSQAQAAFAKAKTVNTSAAYESFLATYAKQDVDVAEARAAYDAARALEEKAKAAFATATSAHTRESYNSFLAQFPATPYSADARERLAACRSEMRNTTTVKNTPLSQSADGSGGSSAEACEAARARATAEAGDSCRQSQGRLDGVRVVSEQPQNQGLEGGRILGSIFGAITGNRRAIWKCSEQISASCQITTSGMHQVEICP